MRFVKFFSDVVMHYSALNGKNREYGIIDTNSQDVQSVIDIFNADWNRTSLSQVNDPNLIVSPINSRSDLTTFINNAQHSLVIEAEELQDSGIIQAIASAAQRGVTVQVILPVPRSSHDPNASGIATIKAAGKPIFGLTPNAARAERYTFASARPSRSESRSGCRDGRGYGVC